MGIAQYDGPVLVDSKELSHEPIFSIEREPDLHRLGDWPRLFPLLCFLLPEDQFLGRFPWPSFSARCFPPVLRIPTPVGSESVEPIDPVETFSISCKPTPVGTQNVKPIDPVEAVEDLFRPAEPIQLPSGSVHDLDSASVFEPIEEPEYIPEDSFLPESNSRNPQPDEFTGHPVLAVPAIHQPQPVHWILRFRQSKPIHHPRHPAILS